MKLLELLKEAGAEVHADGEGEHRRGDIVVTVRHGQQVSTLIVEIKQRAPYPGEIERLAKRRDPASPPLLILADYISEQAGKDLTEHGISYLDQNGNANIQTPTLFISHRNAAPPPKRQTHRLPAGSGSWALIRNLITNGHINGVAAAATEAGVTQPRASQILHQLQDLELVTRTSRSHWEADREALLDAFLGSYSGGKTETTWHYNLDPLPLIADQLVSRAQTTTGSAEFVISGDVAADRLVPWRQPTMLSVYIPRHDVKTELILPESSVTASGPEDANIELIATSESSVFGANRTSRHIAHPTQIVWDLQRLGGRDRFEAANRIKQWILNH